ncbi:MAG TPA: ABC transporter permease subunit, partial [Thermoplasmata archaeon]|nr:ABC transporter permease subunit [Thermoplasmata archaeon]
IRLIPVALGASFLRVILAYSLSFSVALPLALLLYRKPKVARVGLPAVEIVASVPATALFPILVFVLVPSVGLEATSILMLMTGMIWYLFFNLLSGLRAIPPDLDEAARSFGLRRDGYYRRLVFPAVLPALVTGSITAFGGGWNALIVAEYFSSGTRVFMVPGIGELLNLGNNETGGAPLLLATLLTLIFTVVAINELLWKPLYRRVTDRYRYE